MRVLFHLPNGLKHSSFWLQSGQGIIVRIEKQTHCYPAYYAARYVGKRCELFRNQIVGQMASHDLSMSALAIGKRPALSKR